MGEKREGIESEEFLLKRFYVHDSERKGKAVAARCEIAVVHRYRLGCTLKIKR